MPGGPGDAAISYEKPRLSRCRTVIPLLAGIGRGGPGRSGDPGTGQRKGTPPKRPDP
jgi:hypothetical protein